MNNIKVIKGGKYLQQIIEIFRVKRKLGLKGSGFSNPLLIIGESGIGKTKIVEQYAKKKKMLFVKFDLSNVDSTTFNGLMITVKNDDEVIHYHTIPKFIEELNEFVKNGREALIFLDEVNRSSFETRNAVFKLVINNEWGVSSKKLSERIFVIAAMNPSNDDYGDTEELDGAFNKRFIKVEFVPTLEDWLVYAKMKKVHPLVLEILDHEPSLFAVKDINNIEGLDPRSWEDLSYALYAAEKTNYIYDIVEMYSPSIYPKIEIFLKNRKDYISLTAINDIINESSESFRTIKSKVDPMLNKLSRARKIEFLERAVNGIIINLTSDKTYAVLLDLMNDEVILTVFSDLLENMNSKNQKIIDKTESIMNDFQLNTFSNLLGSLEN